MTGRLGFRSRFGKLPAWGRGYGHGIASGQSLGAGYFQAAVTLTQPYGNVQYQDDTKAYNTGTPQMGAGRLIPLVCPIRGNITGTGAASYPANIGPAASPAGETPEVTMVNELTRYALANGFAAFNLATTNVALAGQAASVIKKGGSSNSYLASTFEAAAIAYQCALLGVPYQPLFTLLTHGEADAVAGTSVATYLSFLIGQAANWQTDLQPLAHDPTRLIPMIISQQGSEPQEGVQSANTTALAQFAAFLANGTNVAPILLSGPKYQFGPGFDGLHLAEYRQYAIKLAETLWRYWNGYQASCLYPTSITRSGNVVTINLYVPVPPLVLDTVQAPPHAIGTPWQKWAGTGGLEFHDCDMQVTGATGNGVSPITLTVNAIPAGLSNGDTVATLGNVGNTAANGVWTIANLNVGAKTFQLVGSTGNGTWVLPSVVPVAYRVLGLSGTPSITAQGQFSATIQCTLASTPAAGNLTVGAAHNSDTFTLTGGPPNGVVGAWPSGRCSLWRDSDLWQGIDYSILKLGPWQSNWLVEFEQGGL